MKYEKGLPSRWFFSIEVEGNSVAIKHDKVDWGATEGSCGNMSMELISLQELLEGQLFHPAMSQEKKESIIIEAAYRRTFPPAAHQRSER